MGVLNRQLSREQYRHDLKGQWEKNPHATNGSNAKGNADLRPETQTAPNQNTGARDYNTSAFNVWGNNRRSENITSQSSASKSTLSKGP